VRASLAAQPGTGLGCVPELAKAALTNRAVLQGLIDALRDERPLVAERAANALKKVQAEASRALDPFAAPLIRAALRCEVLKARWNLWAVLGGLALSAPQRAVVVDRLFEAMQASSALERVHAMQALADVSKGDAALQARVLGLLGRFADDASAAVRARAKRLHPRVHSAAQL
jgi:HEAT repeat protein